MKKLTKQSSITLVELPPTQFGILNGDTSFDIYSNYNLPPRALPALEAIIKSKGFTNVNSIKGRLYKEDFSRIYNSDILLVSSITRTAPQSIELTKQYKQNNPNGIAVAGGQDITFMPEDWMPAVDIGVLGEGEKTLSELLDRLSQEPEILDDIDGLVFKKNNEIITTSPRRLLTNEELSQLPHPIYNPGEKYGTMVIETSRGCPNNCDFCTVTKFYGGKYRTKSIEHVIEELKKIRNIGRWLFITDDNFPAIPKRTIQLCEAIVENGLQRPSVIQATVKVADNQQLMQALWNAGTRGLCIGIESINDVTLKDYNKPYTAKQNKEAIRKLREAGFWIHGMMMIGGEGDTKESIRETLEWDNKNLDSVQFFAPIPIPGSNLMKRLEQEDRILTREKYLCDGQYVLVRPKNLTPYELQKTLYGMYNEFYSVKNSLKRIKNSPSKKIAAGLLFYSNFLGRKMIHNPQAAAHLEFLKSVS